MSRDRYDRYDRSDRFGERRRPRGGYRGYRGSRPRRRGGGHLAGKGYRLIVEGLHDGVSWQDLKDIARKAGPSVSFADVRYAGDSKEGVIEYRDYEDFKNAAKELDGAKVNDREIRVFEDKQKNKEFEESLRSDPDRDYHGKSRGYGSRRRSRHRSGGRPSSRLSPPSRSPSSSRSRSRDRSDGKRRRRPRSIPSISRSRSRTRSRSRSRSQSIDKVEGPEGKDVRSRSVSSSRESKRDEEKMIPKMRNEEMKVDDSQLPELLVDVLRSVPIEITHNERL